MSFVVLQICFYHNLAWICCQQVFIFIFLYRVFSAHQLCIKKTSSFCWFENLAMQVGNSMFDLTSKLQNNFLRKRYWTKFYGQRNCLAAYLFKQKTRTTLGSIVLKACWKRREKKVYTCSEICRWKPNTTIEYAFCHYLRIMFNVWVNLQSE